MSVEDPKFFVMLLVDGYAVLDETNESLVASGTFEQVIQYLQQSGACKKDIDFIEVAPEDFDATQKSRLLNALPFSSD